MKRRHSVSIANAPMLLVNPMYEFRTSLSGSFEIYNANRKKLVFSGMDKQLQSKGKSITKYKTVRDMMSEVGGLVSMATYKKISKILCAW